MKKYLIFVVFLFALVMSFCSKKNDVKLKPNSVVGKWTLNQVYGNDYWGGKLYWRPGNADTKIEFTAAHQYYRKNAGENTYTLIGTYQILNDSTMQITQPNTVNPPTITSTLNYSFETGGFMDLGIYAFEGVVIEKFKLEN